MAGWHPHTAPVTEDNPVAARARHWGGVYAAAGEHGVSWFAPQPVVSLQLLDAARVSPDRSVIDVGAGASRLVDALLARGHGDLTALDVSDDGRAISRARLGAAAVTVAWVVADVLAWRPGRRYAVWQDRAVFHFLTDPADRRRYLAVLDQALADDGVVVIGTFAQDGPEACSGLPTAQYCAQELHAALGGRPRWKVLVSQREHHTTPWGGDQPFTCLALARRG